MRIEFDPTNRDEAAAVRAMLTAMHPTTPLRLESATGPGIIQAGRLIPGKDFEPFGEVQSEAVDLYDPRKDPTLEDDHPPLAPQTDSTGTPWDARIHSTPPTTNKDGTWRAKRGVKAEEIAAVKAEREALTVDQQLSEALAETAERLQESTPTEPEFAEALAKNRSGLYMTDVPAQEQTAPPAPNAPVGEQSAPPAPPAPTGQSEAPLAPVVIETAPAETAPTTQSAPVAPSSPSFLDVMKAITAAQKDG